MPRFDVHAYAVVRVRVSNVVARDSTAAAQRVDQLLDLHDFQDARIEGACEVEWAEDVVEYLVDSNDGEIPTTYVIDKHFRTISAEKL